MGTKAGARWIASYRTGLGRPEDWERRRAEGERWCWHHEAWEPAERFGRDRTRIDGLNALCREAKNERARRLYSHHVESPA